jgi:hypothetical protein
VIRLEWSSAWRGHSGYDLIKKPLPNGCGE